jgi:hypothetical protein
MSGGYNPKVTSEMRAAGSEVLQSLLPGSTSYEYLAEQVYIAMGSLAISSYSENRPSAALDSLCDPTAQK